MKTLGHYSSKILEKHRKRCKKYVEGQFDALLNKVKCPCQRLYIGVIRDFIEKADGFVAPADELRDFVDKVERMFFHGRDPLWWIYQPLNDWMESKIFVYSKWQRSAIAKEVMSEFTGQVKVCPYCNSESVYALEVVDRPKPYLSSFDHFFPKHRYPFLALSLYNLIPSCSRCNSQLKLKLYRETWNTYHPYIEDLDNTSRFALVGLTRRMICGQEPADELNIRLMPSSNDVPRKDKDGRLDDYKKLFGIDDVYSTLFQDEALRTLQMGQVINKGYQEDVRRLLPGVDPWQLMFGTPLDRSQIDRHWLSKLKLDVLEGYCGVTVPKGGK